MSERLEQLVKELWQLVDKLECSDSNRFFYPTTLQFTSCRAMDGIRIGKILEEMKTVVGTPARLTETQLLLKNDPHACLDCMGTGDRGRNRQERVWDDCLECGGSGRSQ